MSGGPSLVKGPGPWCGSVGGYTNHACRCEPCTAAQSAYHAAWRASRRRAGESLTPSNAAPVTCWCGRRTKRLPLEDIRAGRTFSCGIGCSRLTDLPPAVPLLRSR